MNKQQRPMAWHDDGYRDALRDTPNPPNDLAHAREYWNGWADAARSIERLPRYEGSNDQAEAV